MCTCDRPPKASSSTVDMPKPTNPAPTPATTTTTTSSSSSSSSTPPTTRTTWTHHLPHHHHKEAAMEITETCGDDDDDALTSSTTTNQQAAAAATRKYTTMKDAHGGTHTTAMSTAAYMVLGAVASGVFTLFSVYFPFWLAPAAAKATYDLAFYHYQDEGILHHFDTTIWTYGTDYFLAVVMIGWSYLLWRDRPSHLPQTRHLQVHPQLLESDGRLCRRIWGLLLGYAISVMAGAVAHQFYTTMEVRNTWHFQLLWTVCVGTVTFASLSMGCIATEMACQFQPHAPGSSLPFIPEIFWQTFGIVTTVVCACGWFSYQRPACDIFIAGITQFPSSFYMITVLWQVGQDNSSSANAGNSSRRPTTASSAAAASPLFLYLRPAYQWMGMASFILNAPLLPLYPLLVQYTDWSLAQVNTFLHAWLFISWSMQAASLIHVRRAVLLSELRPAKAVPYMMPASSSSTSSNMKKDS